MKWMKWVSIVLLASALTGCGHFHGKYGGRSYIADSHSIPPMVVPAGIQSPVRDQFYVVKWPVNYARPPKRLYPPDPYFLQEKNKPRHARRHKV